MKKIFLSFLSLVLVGCSIRAFEKNNDTHNLELLIGSIKNSTAEPIKLALINQLGKVAEPFVTLAPTEEIKGLVFEPQEGLVRIAILDQDDQKKFVFSYYEGFDKSITISYVDKTSNKILLEKKISRQEVLQLKEAAQKQGKKFRGVGIKQLDVHFTYFQPIQIAAAVAFKS